MSQKTITISEETYQKLANLAIGFDTPDNVIQRLLNSVGSLDILDDSSKPKLIFVPNEASFKNELISKRRAEVILYFKDGSRDVIQWNASKFQYSSNLRANLWSGILRNWKEKGIISAEFSVLQIPRDYDFDPELLILIANDLHWKVEEVATYLTAYEGIESDDGHPYYDLASFREDTPIELRKVGGLDEELKKQFFPYRV